MQWMIAQCCRIILKIFRHPREFFLVVFQRQGRSMLSLSSPLRAFGIIQGHSSVIATGGDATDIQWVEARDTPKTANRLTAKLSLTAISTHTRNHPSIQINNAEVRYIIIE